jgi:flagellar FliJ protein
MQALKPLMTLHECAERERDEARNRFERAKAAADAAQGQLEALAGWRADYQARWKAQFAGGSSVEIIRCYQDFMQRLGQAIAEQELTVERTRNSAESARHVLVAREQRVAAVAQLIERRQNEAALALGRREQKATDEMAARALRGGSGGRGLNLAALGVLAGGTGVDLGAGTDFAALGSA